MPALGPCMFALVLGSPIGGSACSGHQTWTLVPVLYRRARVCGARPAVDGPLKIETISCETREPRLYLLPSSRRGDARADETIGSLRRRGDRDFMGDNRTPGSGRTQVQQHGTTSTAPQTTPPPDTATAPLPHDDRRAQPPTVATLIGERAHVLRRVATHRRRRRNAPSSLPLRASH